MVSNIQHALIVNLMDYRRYSSYFVDNGIEPLEKFKRFCPGNGWLLGKLICSKIISKEARSLYLRKINSKRKILEVKQIRYKRYKIIKGKRTKYHSIPKKAIYVYRLKKDRKTFEYIFSMLSKNNTYLLRFLNSDYFMDCSQIEDYKFGFLNWFIGKDFSREEFKVIQGNAENDYKELIYLLPEAFIEYLSTPGKQNKGLSEIRQILSDFGLKGIDGYNHIMSAISLMGFANNYNGSQKEAYKSAFVSHLMALLHKK